MFLLDPDVSVSHMLVLPRHPNAMAEMTPTDPGFTFEDFIKSDPEVEGADPLLEGIGDDLFKVITSILILQYCLLLLLLLLLLISFINNIIYYFL